MTDIKEINEIITVGMLDLAAFSKEHKLKVKREWEKAGTGFLLTKLLKTDQFQLTYTEQNKPFLKGREEHISISHSHDKLVIIINKKENTGIDIELIRDKVINIRHKFLSEKEMFYAGEDVEKLITIWAAKEAMYKVYGLKEVDFSRHLFVSDFNGPVIFGKIELDDFKKNYKLFCERTGDYKLVYVLNEI